APEVAGCFYNRALAYTELDRPDRDQALRDYDRALQLEPMLAVAALNRGLLHARAQRFPEALADLQRALDHGANPTAVHYHLAVVHLARKDRAAALASLQRALQHEPNHAEARKLSESLQRDP